MIRNKLNGNQLLVEGSKMIFYVFSYRDPNFKLFIDSFKIFFLIFYLFYLSSFSLRFINKPSKIVLIFFK